MRRVFRPALSNLGAKYILFGDRETSFPPPPHALSSMPPTDVCCIGSLSSLQVIDLESNLHAGRTSIARSICYGFGTDAPLVAKALSHFFQLSPLLLCNSVPGILRPILADLDANGVDCGRVKFRDGMCPLSVLLRTGELRTWVVTQDLDEIEIYTPTCKVIYIDIYDEFLKTRRSALDHFVSLRNRVTFVNLSSSGLNTKLDYLSTCKPPYVVQVSIGDDFDKAQMIAIEVMERARPEYVVITMGRYGSAVQARDRFIRIPPSQIHAGDYIGAGAVFSAALMAFFIKTDNLVGAAGFATEFVADKLDIIESLWML